MYSNISVCVYVYRIKKYTMYIYIIYNYKYNMKMYNLIT